MTIAFNWRLTFTLDAELQARFIALGSDIKAFIDSLTAKRTTAKFLIACVMQLLTVLVMLSRAMINPSFVASSVYTACA
jgi:hypothetical protein